MSYFNQESERLIFRKLTENDIPNWESFFIKNNRLKYLGITTQKSSKILAEEWIHKQLGRYENQGLGLLAVELKNNKELIGMGGILPRVLRNKEEYEIAYSLKPKYWKKGYATEIAKTMKIYGTDNIETNHFISIIHRENLASINVAQKNGMHLAFKTKFLNMLVGVYSDE